MKLFNKIGLLAVGAIMSIGAAVGGLVNSHETTAVHAAGEWVRVTQLSDLTSGGTFIFGYEATAKSGKIIPMANTGTATTSGNGYMYSGAEAAAAGKTTVDMSTIAATSNFEITVAPATSGSGITLKAAKGYIGNENSKNVVRLYTSEKEKVTNFTASIGANDVITLKNGSSSYHTLSYNTSSPRFACYGGTQKNLVAYKLDAGAPVATLQRIEVAQKDANKIWFETDTVKAEDVVVTAIYDIETSNRTLASNEYTLTNNVLGEGTTTITVTHEEKTATVDFYATPITKVTVEGEATNLIGVKWNLNNLTVTGYTTGDVLVGDITDRCELSTNDAPVALGTTTCTIHVNFLNGVAEFDVAGVTANVVDQIVDTLATFTFGANGSAVHTDGDEKTSYSETSNGYTFSYTGASKVYSSIDAKGNSALKFGTGSVLGTLTFSVPADVTQVDIYAAKYKANASALIINGTTHTLNTNSNDGVYTALSVDTSSVKSITLATTNNVPRVMIDKIEYVGTSYGIVPNPDKDLAVAWAQHFLDETSAICATTKNNAVGTADAALVAVWAELKVYFNDMANLTDEARDLFEAVDSHTETNATLREAAERYDLCVTKYTNLENFVGRTVSTSSNFLTIVDNNVNSSNLMLIIAVASIIVACGICVYIRRKKTNA